VQARPGEAVWLCSREVVLVQLLWSSHALLLIRN
jgi:hypothetical protein